MTTTQLEAGRELDALVAEKVMGWRRWQSPVVPRGRSEADCWRTDNPRSPTVRIRDWSPSTDIGAAWEVVEKMQRRGFACDISVDCYPDGRLAGTQVSFWKASRSDREEWFAEESPLAICRAALAAVEAVA